MKEPFYNLPNDLSEDIEQYSEEVRRYLAGDLAPSIFKARRVARGIYEQRQDNTFMVRVRVAGGTLGCRQARELAALAKKYSRQNQLHVTTRQDVQMHDVMIEDTPEIMRRLYEVGLTSKGGGGNTVRNITACPCSGVCPGEPFDVAPFAHQATEYLISLTGSYNLPRKYKIAFSGCSADCSLARLADLGFIAEVRNGRPGFRVYAGGGMGSHSRAGDALEEWLEASEAVRAAEAMRRLFDKIGDRSNKHRARLRFAVEKIGTDSFRRQFQEEMKLVRDELPECSAQVELRSSVEMNHGPVAEKSDSGSSLTVIQQHQTGLVSLPLSLPMGFVTSDDLKRIAEIAEEHSREKIIRTVRTQDFIIPYIENSSLASLEKRLQSLSFIKHSDSSLSSFVACAGASTCRLGLCLARGAAAACAEKLDKEGPRPPEEISVNISGCPNACGQHPAATLGFFGAAQRTEDGWMPAYKVAVGARQDQLTARLARTLDDSVPAKRLPEFIQQILRDYEKNRNVDDDFPTFLEQRAENYLSDLITRMNRIPTGSEGEDYYWDWGGESRFSLAGRGAGECGAGVFEVIQEDLAEAERQLKKLPPYPDSEKLFQALLPTARALLIVRGVDSREEEAVLRQFESLFLDSGLVDEKFRELLTRARAFRHGWKEGLEGRTEEVRTLWERVNHLYTTLDANLQFNLASQSEKTADNGFQKREETKPKEDVSLQAEPEETAEARPGVFDLSGVPCPMNFVKSKLKLEDLEPGDLLEIILDDGEPIQNVPPSLRNEGHEIVATEQTADGQWRVRVRKNG